ncbi:hypothetical protein [Microbispora hainanensis]|uniref:Uncharacterized protein n=1 Tax=Microbispora hainanensis TaxID=568844 RepID=A0ABZ1SJX1_9ACTN|nr:hypothetical protein [Microbispora hainanensis]
MPARRPRRAPARAVPARAVPARAVPARVVPARVVRPPASCWTTADERIVSGPPGIMLLMPRGR